jgi:hypothetical protein
VLGNEMIMLKLCSKDYLISPAIQVWVHWFL